MSKRPRRHHTPSFKAKLALAQFKGEMTLSQLAEHFDVHPNQITTWKSLLQEGAADVFGGGSGGSVSDLALMRRLDELHLRPPDLMDFSMTPNRRLSAVWCQKTEFRWC